MGASYPQLQELKIQDIKLSNLVDAVTANHLPKLGQLDLSQNKLTDCMEVLMKASYAQLQELNVR